MRVNILLLSVLRLNKGDNAVGKTSKGRKRGRGNKLTQPPEEISDTHIGDPRPPGDGPG